MDSELEIIILDDGDLLISDDNPDMLLDILGGETKTDFKSFLVNRSEVLFGESTLCG